jgi:poly(hydroxyalkanoate) depolymerase family esterase
MAFFTMIDVGEETRLTSQGRLIEAMAILGGSSAFRQNEDDANASALDSNPVAKKPVFEDHSFTNAAGTCTYKLYVPGGHPGEALPLMVMLHGCSQSPGDFATGTGMNDIAEKLGFLVAYPAQTRSANAAKCWNWFNSSDQQRDLGEPSLIAGITREVMRNHPVDGARVFIAGLSAGSAAASIMGMKYPDLYAAIGVHSGLACGAARDMPSALSAMRQGGASVQRSADDTAPVKRTIVFHGDSDRTVDRVNGEQVMDQARAGATLATEVIHGQMPDCMRYTRTVQASAGGQALLEHGCFMAADTPGRAAIRPDRTLSPRVRTLAGR